MKKFYIYPILAMLVLGAFVFVSCSNSNFPMFEEKQSVQFNAIMSSQLHAPTHIVYLDENFAKREILVSNSIKNENRIELSLNKNQLTPILVYSGDADGQPYGCIYPLSTTISEKGGFNAWILYKLLVSSNESPTQVYNLVSRFNWKRFDGYIQKREDPWLLDQQRIFENIADGTFNVYSLKDK